ncbi:MAG: dUTP diphosphatase [Eubacteriales bacterium]
MQAKVKLRLIEREGCPSPCVPEYATTGSAACDLRASIPSPITVDAGGRVTIPTGIAISLHTPELVALVASRSGLAVKRGLTLSNGIGVIDSDYTGEISVGLVNLSDSAYTIQPGERIAQLLLMPVVRALFEVVEELPSTQRGEGGFGSTGSC